MKVVKGFYVDSRACVPVENDVSEWFPALWLETRLGEICIVV